MWLAVQYMHCVHRAIQFTVSYSNLDEDLQNQQLYLGMAEPAVSRQQKQPGPAANKLWMIQPDVTPLPE